MRARKVRLEGNYVRERLRDPDDLRAAGYTRFRTKVVGRHRVILAILPGRRARGRVVAQAVLHPLSEVAGPDRKFTCRDGRCRRVTGG